MGFQQKNAQCCHWFHASEPVTTVQCQFWTTFGKDLPDKKPVTCWCDDVNKGCICKGMNSDWPSTSGWHVEWIIEDFEIHTSQTIEPACNLEFQEPLSWAFILNSRMGYCPINIWTTWESFWMSICQDPQTCHHSSSSGFHQRLCLHTTNGTILDKAMRPNFRCNCRNWCNGVTEQLGEIPVLIRHLPHNSWCTCWTLVSKTCLSLHVQSISLLWLLWLIK